MGGLAVSGLLRKGGHRFLVFIGMIAFDISFGASLGRAEVRCDVREEETEYRLERSSSVNSEVGSPLLLSLRAREDFSCCILMFPGEIAHSQGRDSPAWPDLCRPH